MTSPLGPIRPLSANHANVRRLLAAAGVLGDLSPADATVLAEQLELFEMGPRTTIFSQGEPGDRLFIIVSGKVKITQHTPDRRQALLAVLGPSDVFGELSLLDPGPRTSTATTVTPALTASIDHHALSIWLSRSPRIAERLLQVLAARVRRTNDQVADMTFRDVPSRVAKQLLRLAQRFGAHSPAGHHVRHDLSQKELSQLVGASRETVKKALVDFDQRGWIVLEPKSVLILDSVALGRRAR